MYIYDIKVELSLLQPPQSTTYEQALPHPVPFLTHS